MAGGKIKGISKKEGGDIKKFECVSGEGRGLFGSLIFFSSWAGVPTRKRQGID